MNELFRVSDTFASLSVKDLVQARDLFHYQLMSKRNVVATAIGLYRFRHGDPWPTRKHPKASHPRKRKAKRRTLFNSEVRPYSWPCVYVFVSAWDTEERLAKGDPSDIVPRTLLLPDGRAVPVCVIEARRDRYSSDVEVDPSLLHQRAPLTPGMPIVNPDGQGRPRIATAGCLVTDGQAYYVLTSRHALGPEGTAIEVFRRNGSAAIGETVALGETRVPFKDVYPHFQSEYQYLLMDTGLVGLRDVQQWSTRFSGLPQVEDVLDLYDNNLTLRLIGQKVVGHGAVTGPILGEIHGLFYRYKALGGYEYLTDFLIGPRTDTASRAGVTEPPTSNVPLTVHHGDSGTVLFLDEPPRDTDTDGVHRYHPFGLLWGRHEFLDGRERTSQPFVLATSLSVALQRLNLDFVRDLNLDNDLVWGWVGHYVIGGLLPFSVGLLKSPKLRQFAEKNIDLLTLAPDEALGNDPKVVEKKADGTYDLTHPQFVPLADVPDNVWKGNVNVYITKEGGASTRHAGPGARQSADNPNHFGDLDLPYDGAKTFLEYNLKDPEHRLRPDVWVAYYQSLKPKYEQWAAALGKHETTQYKHWGALPFRIWQLFDTMSGAAADGDAGLFLTAGGVLIHYVGDACQPLHTSYLSQGDPDSTVKRPNSQKRVLEADGVHGGYEDEMVNFGYQKKALVKLIQAEITKQRAKSKEKIATVRTGFDAANAALRLIAATHATLAPSDIVAKWVEVKGRAKKDRVEAMWAALGPATVACMARGCRYLAAIWQGAWDVGKGNKNIGAGSALSEKAIAKLYNDPKVLPSIRLDKYSAVLKGIPKP